jgi:dTDP-4-dehydrorhamnose 3,5-epimerase
MFNVQNCKIPGCFLLTPKVFKDDRGVFIKNFNQSDYEKLGLNGLFLEDFYTSSKKNVIRGMHFAKPPSDHIKTISCVEGTIFDVLIDLRLGSPTYGVSETLELAGAFPQILYAPIGIAHGFCSLTDNSIVQYKVSKLFCPEDDIGIHWDSIGIDWPTKQPIISSKDTKLPRFSDFKSPFNFEHK